MMVSGCKVVLPLMLVTLWACSSHTDSGVPGEDGLEQRSGLDAGMGLDLEPEVVLMPLQPCGELSVPTEVDLVTCSEGRITVEWLALDQGSQQLGWSCYLDCPADCSDATSGDFSWSSWNQLGDRLCRVDCGTPDNPGTCSEETWFESEPSWDCVGSDLVVSWTGIVGCFSFSEHWDEDLERSCSVPCGPICDLDKPQLAGLTGNDYLYQCENGPCAVPQWDDCTEVTEIPSDALLSCQDDRISVSWTVSNPCFTTGTPVSCSHDCPHGCLEEPWSPAARDGNSVVEAMCDPGCVGPEQYQEIELSDLPLLSIPPEGLSVSVGGVVSLGNPVCDTQECPEEEPCCNSCFATLKLTDSGGELPLAAGQVETVGCEGNICEFEQNCQPLAVGGSYRVWGTLKLSYSFPVLHLDGWCVEQ